VSNIKQQLAQALADLIAAKGQPIAQTARDLGYTRQRLHQLKSGDRTAGLEAIEEAIHKLGYEVKSVSLQPKNQP